MRENIEFFNYSLDRHLTAISIISCCLHIIRLASRNLLLTAEEWLMIQTVLFLFSNEFPNTKQQALRCRELHPYFDGNGKCVADGTHHKVHPITGYEDPEVAMRYSSTLSFTSAVDGVGGQSHAPAALPLVKTRYQLYRRLGGPHGRSGRMRKTSTPPGFDPPIVQPVATRYTDCAIPTLRWYTSYLHIVTVYI